MDLYSCPTDVIDTFHSLSDSGIAIGGYPSIVLMIFYHMFFFSRKMACSSSVLAFMANVVATTHHSRTNDLTMGKALQWAIK